VSSDALKPSEPKAEPKAAALPPAEIAPDGSLVQPLLRTPEASCAEFRLEAGRVSRAVRHRTVVELWRVLEGTGELHIESAGQTVHLTLGPGVTAHIPREARFQFRAISSLRIFAVTIPPWPGDDEAIAGEGL